MLLIKIYIMSINNYRDHMDENVQDTAADNDDKSGSEPSRKDLLTKLLGEAFNPWSPELTEMIGKKIGLEESSKVLEVACGPGSSALVLAEKFGCTVIGVDPSEKNIMRAKERAEEKGLSDNLEFITGSLEKLDFEDERFDAVICESTLNTLDNKIETVREMHRVVRKGGRLGTSDLVINGELPLELDALLKHMFGLNDALSGDDIFKLLTNGGFSEIITEEHNETITNLVNNAEKMLMGVSMLEQMFNFDLQKLFGITYEDVNKLIASASSEIEKGTVGYWIFIGSKL
jgi:ubiquinone/menaquinone biosynthesis C-methylase UbiE